MPSKKKKYNSRFPPARIKKIMQTDEDVGKVAAAVPVIISRALEMFIESLIHKANFITQDRNAKTLSAAHLKQAVLSERNFDFLKDLVASIPDVTNEDEAISHLQGPFRTPDGQGTALSPDPLSIGDPGVIRINQNMQHFPHAPIQQLTGPGPETSHAPIQQLTGPGPETSHAPIQQLTGPGPETSHAPIQQLTGPGPETSHAPIQQLTEPGPETSQSHSQDSSSIQSPATTQNMPRTTPGLQGVQGVPIKGLPMYQSGTANCDNGSLMITHKPRGRPPKKNTKSSPVTGAPKRGRGRPRKQRKPSTEDKYEDTNLDSESNVLDHSSNIPLNFTTQPLERPDKPLSNLMTPAGHMTRTMMTPAGHMTQTMMQGHMMSVIVPKTEAYPSLAKSAAPMDSATYPITHTKPPIAPPGGLKTDDDDDYDS